MSPRTAVWLVIAADVLLWGLFVALMVKVIP